MSAGVRPNKSRGPKLGGSAEHCPSLWISVLNLRINSNADVLVVAPRNEAQSIAQSISRKDLYIVKKYTCQSATDRAKRERELLQYAHPNIVKLSPKDKSANDANYVPLELMDLGSLKEFVSKLDTTHRVISKESLAGLTKAIAVSSLLGLQYLHAHGCIHRDVKPENLLMNRAGRIKWCDFECSFSPKLKAVENPAATAQVATTLTGTDGYVAPEMLKRTGDEYTNAVDIWGLGIVLYWLLTREIPAALKDISEYMRRHYQNPEMDAGELFNWTLIHDEGLRNLLQHGLLVGNPQRRLSATQALHHTCLQDFYKGSWSTEERPEELANVANKLKAFGIPMYDGSDDDELKRLIEVAHGRSTEHCTIEEQGRIKRDFHSVVFTRQSAAVEYVKKFVEEHCQSRSFDVVGEEALATALERLRSSISASPNTSLTTPLAAAAASEVSISSGDGTR